MNIDDNKERQQIVGGLRDYAQSISTGLDEDNRVSLWRMRDTLSCLSDHLEIERGLNNTLIEMDKSRQITTAGVRSLRGTIRSFVKNILVARITLLIAQSKWEQSDFKVQIFQEQLRQKMESMRDWYVGAYDL